MSATPGSVSIEGDVVFGSAGDLELKGDIYHPPAALNKRTAVIHVYGGGFERGNRMQAGDAAHKFAERGYPSLTVWHRLTHEGKWPAPVHDVKTAIRWARANAGRLAIDATKIAVSGYSSGGQVALIVAGSANLSELEGDGGNAGRGTDVAACIAYYVGGPVSRLSNGEDHPVMPPGSSDEAYHAADAITYVRPGFPPTALLHSTTDHLAPFELSLGFFHALRDAGAKAELHLFEGLSHIFDRYPEFGSACADLCDLFLDRNVVDPRDYPPHTPSRPGRARRA